MTCPASDFASRRTERLGQDPRTMTRRNTQQRCRSDARLRRLMRRTTVSRLAFLLLQAVACAPALSSFTPAHVAPRKHVQAEVGLDVSIPTGTIGHVVDVGEALADS